MDDPEQGAPPRQLNEDSPPAQSADGVASGADGVAGGAVDAKPATPSKPPRTRTSVAFQGFLFGAVVLALMLIFILENTEDVKINYLGAKGHISLGVALLLAAVGGALLVAILAAVRISQLRLHARRQRRR